MKETTQRHLEVFKKEVLFWINRFGLQEWEVTFSHSSDDSVQAFVNYNLLGRVCTFGFPLRWTDALVPLNNTIIQLAAKHEVIELLLAEVHSIGAARYISANELDAAHHALVRRLEKLITK